jgi:hypothetical protein
VKARITRLHFLRALFAGFYREHRGYIFVRTAAGENFEAEQRHFLDIQTLADETYSSEADVSFGVCPRRTMRGDDEDVGHVIALWADLDVGSVGHGSKASFFATPQDLAAAVRAFPAKPSIVVESGRGAHLYWLLNRAHEVNERGKIEKILKDIARRLGCDMGTSLSTLLRLPNTVNNKVPGRRTYCGIRYINFDARYALEDFENLDRHITPSPARPQVTLSGKIKQAAVRPKEKIPAERGLPAALEEIDLTRNTPSDDIDFGDESYLRSHDPADHLEDCDSRGEWDSNAEIIFDDSSDLEHDDLDPTDSLVRDVHELSGQLTEAEIGDSSTIELTDSAINEVLATVHGVASRQEATRMDEPIELSLDAPVSEDFASMEQSPCTDSLTLNYDATAELSDLLKDELLSADSRPEPVTRQTARNVGHEDEIDLTKLDPDGGLEFDIESVEAIASVEPAPVGGEPEGEILLYPMPEDVEPTIHVQSLRVDKDSPQDTFVGEEEKRFLEAPSIEPISLSRISGLDEVGDEIALDAIDDHEFSAYLEDEDFKAHEIESYSDVEGHEDEGEIDLTTQGKEPPDTGPFLRFEGLDLDVAGLIIPSLSDADALAVEPEGIAALAPELPSGTHVSAPFIEPYPPAKLQPVLTGHKHSRGCRNIGLRRFVRSRRACAHRGKKPLTRPGFLRRKIGGKPRRRRRGR